MRKRCTCRRGRGNRRRREWIGSEGLDRSLFELLQREGGVTCAGCARVRRKRKGSRGMLCCSTTTSSTRFFGAPLGVVRCCRRANQRSERLALGERNAAHQVAASRVVVLALFERCGENGPIHSTPKCTPSVLLSKCFHTASTGRATTNNKTQTRQRSKPIEPTSKLDPLRRRLKRLPIRLHLLPRLRQVLFLLLPPQRAELLHFSLFYFL